MKIRAYAFGRQKKIGNVACSSWLLLIGDWFSDDYGKASNLIVYAVTQKSIRV